MKKSKTSKEKTSSEESLQLLISKFKKVEQQDPGIFNEEKSRLAISILRIHKRQKSLSSKDAFQLIGGMMEFALYKKTGEKKDWLIAKSEYEKILSIDPLNAEANYRYAFINYCNGNWINAIKYFNDSLDSNSNEDFPLTEDQNIKAHLFIGVCSAELLKKSVKFVEELLEETYELPHEGISVEDLKMKLKTELQKSELVMITEKCRQSITLMEYEEIEDNLKDNELLLSFVDSQQFIKYGEGRVEINGYNAIILKDLLLKSAENKPLTLINLSSYPTEDIAKTDELTWENYRRKISRLRAKLATIGLSELFIENVPNTQGYKMAPINFYIIAREDLSI